MGRKKKETQNQKAQSGLLNFPHMHLASDTKRTLVVVVILAIVVLSVMSFVGAAGAFGSWWNKALFVLFGYFAYVSPLVLLAVGVSVGWPKALSSFEGGWAKRTSIGFTIAVLATVGLWHSINSNFTGQPGFSSAFAGHGAGLLGALVSVPLMSLFGFWATVVVLIALLFVGVVIALNVPVLVRKTGVPEQVKPTTSLATSAQIKINSQENANFTSTPVEVPQAKVVSQKSIKDVAKVSPMAEPILPDAVILEERKDWKLPPFDLLDDRKAQVDSGNIEANVAIIQKTLADFGIEVEMGEVNVGPTVTQYTLRPATGVKLSQIAALKNDLTLALAAHAIRMELPIPGKPLVGIEVPNKTSRIVSLREVLQTADFINHPSRLAFALGRDVAGHAQIADLAKMPHLLIAGSTGTGKSVSLNTFVISLLYRNTPQDVKLIMVDPKRVEMTMYNGIPHLLTAPITEPEKAVNAFKWAVSEMDRRYKLLADSKKRNIMEYNQASPLPLSYIVINVDELADLMAVAQADIEAAIVRLAQMARAVGIHLVLATQRPSVDIITGLIKANITARVAFAVASQIDSRTILDSGGAEQLLGNGDMLYISSDFNKPRRIQGAYVGEKEVGKVVDFFKVQAGAVIYSDEIIQRPKHALSIPGFESGDADGDELLEQAKDEVLRAGKASASFLQRRLKVGYARAARLLDLLEEQGIIGPGDGAKPREVYGAASPHDEGYGEASEQPFEDENL